MTGTPARRLALSLDNGPDLEQTPRVLDILAERSIRAVFFMIGEKVAAPAGRDMARRVTGAGHRVGNHTMTHGTPLGLRPDDEAVAEIAQADEVLAEFACDPPLFRPNAGFGKLGPHVLSPAAVDYLVRHGHTTVTWTSVPRDWEEPEGSWVQRALDAVEHTEHSMLVLHDVLATTADRLGSFLDTLRDRGVEFTDEFPAGSVLISGGRRLPPLQGLVSTDMEAGSKA
ncbi:MAG TPA: polysaccharide deacetylase family protein [Streptosporangiaceae bacterium]|jgi:peptidoglycan/xylan/chitin deacetylase (PgdA/CDA1 family)|nr:polysaccharide deacetylase family protein [Streptosporangiaceae bacterium]